MSEISRLKWHCRRGMKELDLLLENYLAQHYPTASDREQHAFQAILALQDPELFGYIVGRDAPADPEMAAVIEKIRGFLP